MERGCLKVDSFPVCIVVLQAVNGVHIRDMSLLNHDEGFDEVAVHFFVFAGDMLH